MKKFFTEEEIDGMSEIVCMAIEEHGWLCDDGHWLTDEELAEFERKAARDMGSFYFQECKDFLKNR